MSDIETPVSVCAWKEPTGGTTLVGGVGFEDRSQAIAAQFAGRVKRTIAWEYSANHFLSYDNNRSFFESITDNDIPTLDSESFNDWIRIAIGEVVADGADAAVDISVMSRDRIASCVRAAWNALTSAREGQRVDFLYAISEHYEPPDMDLVVQVSGPATPDYAGWQPSLEDPLAAIVGLGYESELSRGVLEQLEPAEVWAFVPFGDLAFNQGVQSLNQGLLEDLAPDRVVTYPVGEPLDIYASLESLVYGLSQSSRPILIPFGPKVFSLVSLLVSEAFGRSVPVWRVSAGEAIPLLDRSASGTVVGIGLCSKPRRSEEAVG